MNSIQLEYFLNVAKAGSFTLAAKKLFISQPALSKQIKLLEEELGCILMLRSADGIHLTPEGKKLLQRAEDITGKIKSIPQEMNQLHHTVAGELNIVCGTLLTRKIMPGLLKRLLQKYPEICPRIRENPVREHADLLRNSSADIGIGNIYNCDKHLAIHPLFSSDLVLIRSVNSDL
ncbi:MAG: LysR family transcriptional regulator, partial [Lentisphaeria bacterium]|nr:LysR family transcriptional regulator [Lentisphaeria bacterium]